MVPKGFFADKVLTEEEQNEQQRNQQSAYGHLIDEMDFFEQEKISLLRKFDRRTIDDDLFVIHNRNQLM